MNEDFGTTLRRIRKERHLTLDKMAEMLGTTKQALSRYERGERTPKITAAARFAEILDVPLELLVGYEYHENDPQEVFDKENTPQTVEARSLAKGIDKMPESQRKAILTMMMSLYPGAFEEGTEDDD